VSVGSKIFYVILEENVYFDIRKENIKVYDCIYQLSLLERLPEIVSIDLQHVKHINNGHINSYFFRFQSENKNKVTPLDIVDHFKERNVCGNG